MSHRRVSGDGSIIVAGPSVLLISHRLWTAGRGYTGALCSRYTAYRSINPIEYPQAMHAPFPWKQGEDAVTITPAQFSRLWHSDNPHTRLRALGHMLAAPAGAENVTTGMLLDAFEALWGPSSLALDTAQLDPSLEGLVVDAIGDRADPASIEPLLAYLESAAADARVVACGLLGRWKEPRARVRIEQLLADPKYFVQVIALQALVRFGDPESLAAIDRYLRAQDRSNSAHLLAARQVMESLGQPKGWGEAALREYLIGLDNPSGGQLRID